MKRLVVQIDYVNGLSTEPEFELSKIFLDLSQTIPEYNAYLATEDTSPIMDANGNRVGSWRLVEIPEPEQN